MASVDVAYANHAFARDLPMPSGEAVWTRVGEEYRLVRDQKYTAKWLMARMPFAMRHDFASAQDEYMSAPFATPLSEGGAVPSSVFHVVLGFIGGEPDPPVAAASKGIQGIQGLQLEIGARPFGAQHAGRLAPGTMVPALELEDGRCYPIPNTEYHEIRLVGIKDLGFPVYAVGVRLSPEAYEAAIARPPCDAGGVVVFASGCAKLPSEVCQRIPEMNAPGRPSRGRVE